MDAALAVLEALGDLAAVGVPPRLRQVIHARVDRPGEAARGLLGRSSGRNCPSPRGRPSPRVSEEALLDVAERAAKTRPLVETTDGIRSAHALVREVLQEHPPAATPGRAPAGGARRPSPRRRGGL